MWYSSVHKPIIMGAFLRLSALQGLAHYQYQETLVELLKRASVKVFVASILGANHINREKQIDVSLHFSTIHPSFL